MKKSRLKPAPKTLIPEAKAWWKKILSEYQIDDEVGLLLLQTALEAFGTMRCCDEQIKSDGLTVLDRFEQRKAHPLLTVQRDARCFRHNADG